MERRIKWAVWIWVILLGVYRMNFYRELTSDEKILYESLFIAYGCANCIANGNNDVYGKWYEIVYNLFILELNNA